MATKKHVVSGDAYRTIDRRMGEIKRQLGQEGGSPLDPECVAWVLQQLTEGKQLMLVDHAMNVYGGVNQGGRCSTVSVPDLPFDKLVDKVEADIRAKCLRLTHLHDAYKAWDHTQYRVAEGEPAKFIEVRGERFEVLTWEPCAYKTNQQVRDYFAALPSGSADGNTAAFLVWVEETMPFGYHVSIPSEDALLWRDPQDILCAPCFYRDGYRRILDLNGGGRWDIPYVFVAFRKLPRA